MRHEELFGNAIWVSPADAACTAPYIRGRFSTKKPQRAVLTICGLGFFELYINGKRYGNDLLVPANSDYEPRDLRAMSYPIHDRMRHRIYCMQYAITDCLQDGVNRIGVQLGTGWYAQTRRVAEGDVTFGPVKLCYRLQLTDASGAVSDIGSDLSLKWAQSEITMNSIYHGEQHDYTLYQDGWACAEYDDSAWEPVVQAKTPDSRFFVQTCPPDRVTRTLQPKVHKRFADFTVYDAGENSTGHAVVVCPKAGDCVRVQYAEEVNADGTLDFASCGGAGQIQQNIYENTIAGKKNYPHFTWHGFRYFSVTNNAAPTEVEIVHSDIAVTSSFTSDNAQLNWLYDAYIRTQLANMHGGVPSDCPHIERLGYTGDGQLCAETAMLLLDSRAFYRKWMEDIADCQSVDNGHIQHTAPFAGGGGGPSGWGGAVVVVPWQYYLHYGDTAVLREFYPRMLRYFDYMESRSDAGLVTREEPGGWCLGDWCTPGGIQIPETYVNTCLYIKFLQIAAQIAEILNERQMLPVFQARMDCCSQAVLRAYYSPMTHSFLGDLQGANSFAVDIGLGDEHTYENIVKKYTVLGEFDTGIFGTDILPRLLFERGNAELAAGLLASKGKNAFYNMQRHGATTLWEYWDGKRSHSHPMFGAATRYLFQYLLGIRQREGTAGYVDVLIAPQPVSFLQHYSGHVTTPNGRIAVQYQRQEGVHHFVVQLAQEIPAEFQFGSYREQLHSGENQIRIADEVN